MDGIEGIKRIAEMMTAIMPWNTREGTTRKKESGTELIAKEVDNGERGRSANGGQRKAVILQGPGQPIPSPQNMLVRD
jgi:hypothetical protein